MSAGFSTGLKELGKLTSEKEQDTARKVALEEARPPHIAALQLEADSGDFESKLDALEKMLPPLPNMEALNLEAESGDLTDHYNALRKALKSMEAKEQKEARPPHIAALQLEAKAEEKEEQDSDDFESKL